MRGFTYFATATLISLFGSEIFSTVLPFLVFHISRSHTDLSWVLASASVAQAVLLLAGGLIVDRVSLRSLLVAGDATRLVLELALLWLYFTSALSLWSLIGFSVLNGGVRAVINPASRAAMPSVLPRSLLAAGISAQQIGQEVCTVAGPPLAGALVPWIGLGGAVSVDVATFAASLALTWIGFPSIGRPELDHGGMLRQIADGIVYLRHRPWLRDSIALTAMGNWLFAGAVSLALPILSVDQLLGVKGYGVLTGAQAAGSAIGAFVVGRHVLSRFTVMRYSILTMVEGLQVAGVAAAVWLSPTPALAVAAALMVTFGFNIMFVGVEYEQALQTRVNPHMLGRVLSVDQLGSMASIPVGYLVTGVVIAALGPQATVGVYGGLIVCRGLGGAILAHRRADAYAISGEDE